MVNRKANTNIPTPSKKSISKCLKKWDSTEKYILPEKAIDKLFYFHCPHNRDIESIIPKVCTLNDIYSTMVFDTYAMAKHILKLDIDARLKSGDYKLVNDIALVRAGKKKKKRNFYSFASKYCSHHNPETFPIYDSYVDKMLRHYRNKDKFSDFKSDDLKSYPKFISVIEDLMKHYKVESYSIKQLDIFLWSVGKKYFPIA